MTTENDRGPLSSEVKRLESEVGPRAYRRLVYLRLFEQFTRRNVFRVIALAALTGLLAIVPVRVCMAQSTKAAAQSALIKSYVPELQRLQKAGDWSGLERVSKQALSASEAKTGSDSIDVATASSFLAVALENQGRYAEAEPIYRRELAIVEKALGPEHPDTSVSLSNLAELLRHQGRYAEAEPLFRRALAINEKTFGPQDPKTAIALDNLALVLLHQGRYPDAEPLNRRALAIWEKALGPEHPDTAISLNNLASLLKLESRYAEAEPLFRRALAITEKALGPEHRDSTATTNLLALLLRDEGRYAEAEPLLRHALGIREKALGPEHPDTATSLNSLAALLQDQGRFAEAELLLRRALAIREKVGGPEDPDTSIGVNNLAELLRLQGRYAEAEPLYRRALAIREKVLGPEHPYTASTLNNLAILLEAQGRYAEAEPPFRRALSTAEKILGPEHPHTAATLNNLALLLQHQGRYAEAEPLRRRGLAIYEKVLGPEHPSTMTARANLGGLDELQGRWAEASANFRLACTALSKAGRARSQNTVAEERVRLEANNCSGDYSLALWAWSSQGGGTAPNDRPDALKLEAFAASQLALQSAAGEAMARSAALTAAKSSGVGREAQAYEASLRERDSLDQQFVKAAGESGQGRIESRQALSHAHDAVVSRIERLEAELKAKTPLYWDYRSPEPVSIAALQAKVGTDAVLLHDDEALVVCLVGRGKSKGLVFAISKDRVAWAQLGLTADALRDHVARLRAQIDPYGYKLRAVASRRGTNSNNDSDSSEFDRQLAYELYQDLLGDASIQTVIRDKAVLLFVPSGPLTALPPGLLVTEPPPGGAKRDGDAEALRSTAWLLRAKAVAVLPAVSSLRTLRQLLPAARAKPTDALLAFADPDFERPGSAPSTTSRGSNAVRAYTAYYRDGVPLAEALNGLPSLPGTRIEAEALQRALGGGPGSLLMGRDASKAQLMARNGDGRLAQVRVLEFATHGLVAGDASDLIEPALVLAAGVKPEDELLLASEAATLRLNADWVLLSACNTASPDAPEGQGLSGLSRAFFYAGARSLLVSHWRVRDDVAPLLIPAMLLAERNDSHLSRAQALRQASLAILDNPDLHAASPSAWAAFALVGEAAR